MEKVEENIDYYIRKLQEYDEKYRKNENPGYRMWLEGKLDAFKEVRDGE